MNELKGEGIRIVQVDQKTGVRVLKIINSGT